MTVKELAKILVEDAYIEHPNTELEKTEDPTVKLYLDRLLLRIFQTPGLMVSLVDVQTINDPQGHIIQLDFGKLPPQVVGGLKSVIGPGRIKLFKFEKDGEPHTGVEILITPKDLEQAKEVARSAAKPEADRGTRQLVGTR